MPSPLSAAAPFPIGAPMRTDYELVRRMMCLAADVTCPFEIEGIVDDRNGRSKVGRHAKLLVDAGLLDAKVVSADDDPYYAVTINGVTFEGQKFADNVRDAEAWREMKAKLLRVGGTVAIDVFVQLAASVVASKVLG